jgi:hypothetical protein
MSDEREDPCSPGNHSHSDRPNWHPAETAEEYFRNCDEGLEQYSDRRMAKLLGMSRTMLWRAKLVAELPRDLFETLVESSPPPSAKQLAQIALALRREGNDVTHAECCPSAAMSFAFAA